MDQTLRIGLAFASCALFAASASAQGSDSCASATAIAGTGSFAVTTTGATDSAQQTGVCVTAHRDVWFAWTASATQAVTIALCGGTSVDTVLAVWPGPGCPSAGTQLACNDDSCGQQSQVTIGATSGNTYMIQIGAFGTSTTFNGTFTIGASTCGTSVGPDVITGAITDVFNATAGATLDAFTVGTTSCNIGTQVVNWQGPNNLHPLICEACYKYKVVGGAGRFEQVGMSWLKHGFAADTGSLCCTCQDPNNNQRLGLGCSDPYVASQSATQSGLTPRWQVNANTGFFPYPGANPTYSGTTARRCEVALADLEPSGGGVSYWVEATYVTQDDAQAGNGNNNESYRAMDVTGGPTNYTFTPTGSTARMQSAIRAWPLVEPGVTLSNVQVPGEGLFVVGSNATSLGGGQYRYEFAVHNMNSERSGGSFTVPLPPGVVVTNIGFHDVTYRNGDGEANINRASTDWPGVVSGNSIVWACETFAQNTNANAIRWQTTYNFRFDANVAPTNGTVALGLWKGGSPAAMTAVAEVPGGGTGTLVFCFGDGSGAACPCGNQSAAGANAGCLNSLGSGGALSASGTPSITADTFVLAGAGMPDSSALYFQGTTQIAGGTAFGDGLRCAGGSVLRLGTTLNAGGASQYPSGGSPAISVQGADAIGDVRTYQCWYRNAASFCQPETFNLTNGLQTTWQP